MNCEKVTGLMSGAWEQFAITMEDGTVWQGHTVFKDRISLCLQHDKWYSYSLDLGDTAFFSLLEAECLKHQQSLTPGATIEHIQVNIGTRSLDSYRVLDSTQSASADLRQDAVAEDAAKPQAPNPSDVSDEASKSEDDERGDE